MSGRRLGRDDSPNGTEELTRDNDCCGAILKSDSDVEHLCTWSDEMVTCVRVLFSI